MERPSVFLVNEFRRLKRTNRRTEPVLRLSRVDWLFTSIFFLYFIFIYFFCVNLLCISSTWWKHNVCACSVVMIGREGPLRDLNCKRKVSLCQTLPFACFFLFVPSALFSLRLFILFVLFLYFIFRIFHVFFFNSFFSYYLLFFLMFLIPFLFLFFIFRIIYVFF